MRARARSTAREPKTRRSPSIEGTAYSPELLCPAGDFERLAAAVLYGADAVYLAGKQFGMRGSPANFGAEELLRAVRYCHERGVRVYLTCNTLPRGEEAAALPEFIRFASSAGVDALIVADLGVLMLAKRIAPDLEIHVSTQAGVVNYLTANELHNLGASRVILARELSLDEIKRIRDKTPPTLAIETFVHGAMCVSFSGRCLLSEYLTGRDSNRGQCAQPCRWSYHLVEEKRPGQLFPIAEDERGTHILNAQDLCLLPYLDKLAEAGITSFKIEGRAKSAYYVAVVTNAYRTALDHMKESQGAYHPPQWVLDEVYKVSHREYCTGFYFPDSPPGQCYEGDGYVRGWEVAATVIGVEDGLLLCQEKNRFAVGDRLELLRLGKEPVELLVESMWDEDGSPIQVANHPLMKLRIPFGEDCSPGALLRRQT